MKRFAFIALGLAGLFAGLFAEAPPVHSVYVLPMASGLDQYLAEKIAHGHILVVVANPKTADAVLTDRPSFHGEAGKGTIFLVDAHSRQVLWSDYEKPGGNPEREAERIAKKLQDFSNAGH
jgi:hypothetical protein